MYKKYLRIIYNIQACFLTKYYPTLRNVTGVNIEDNIAKKYLKKSFYP